jgi:hypothetical protein
VYRRETGKGLDVGQARLAPGARLRVIAAEEEVLAHVR